MSLGKESKPFLDLIKILNEFHKVNQIYLQSIDQFYNQTFTTFNFEKDFDIDKMTRSSTVLNEEALSEA